MVGATVMEAALRNNVPGIDADEADRRIRLCGKGAQQLAAAAGDIDDGGEALPSRQLEEGAGE